MNNTEQTWFNNYWLQFQRTQSVTFSGATSDECYISCGVPQGSILGPLLFVVYINDFTKSINHSKVVLYADDTILLFADKNPDIIKSKLESDLSCAQVWFHKNNLNLNVSKCKWLMYSTETEKTPKY